MRMIKMFNNNYKFTLLFLCILSLSYFSSCKNKSENDINKKKYDELLFLQENKNESISNSGISNSANKTVFAVVKENNVPIFSVIENGEIIGYLHKGMVENFEINNDNNIKIENSSDKYFSINILGKDRRKITGFVYEKYLQIIQIPKNEHTNLTNAKIINNEIFPVKEKNIFYYVGHESLPNILEKFGDWIEFEDTNYWWGSYGLSMHIKDLPEQFFITIYDSKESINRKYLSYKNKFDIEDIPVGFHESDVEKYKPYLPIYTFYFSAPLSTVSGKYKTEIRSLTNEIIYSDYIEYPEIPFRIERLNNINYYIQYRTETPFYLVIYEHNFDENDSIPICAFENNPENGFWEGLLTLGPEFENNNDYRIFLFQNNTGNNKSIITEIDGFWNNYISKE